MNQEQARAFGGEYVCMNSPPRGRVCITQTWSLMDFLAPPPQPADLPPPGAGRALPSQRLWLSGADTARGAADDVSQVRRGWVKWLNVPGRYGLGEPRIPSPPNAGLLRGFGAPTAAAPGTGLCRQHELMLTHSKY